MLDAAQQDNKIIYPAWLNDPRQVWSRALIDLPMGCVTRAGLPEGMTVMRTGWSRFEVRDNNGRLLFAARYDHAGGKQGIVEKQAAVEEVVAFLTTKLRKGDEEMDEFQPNEKAMALLRFVKEAGKPIRLDGRTYPPKMVASLIEYGLLMTVSIDQYDITAKGADALERETQPPFYRPSALLQRVNRLVQCLHPIDDRSHVGQKLGQSIQHPLVDAVLAARLHPIRRLDRCAEFEHSIRCTITRLEEQHVQRIVFLGIVERDAIRLVHQHRRARRLL